MRPRFPAHAGVRAIVRVALDRIADSCGFGVPLLRYEHERDQQTTWAATKDERQVVAYQRAHNVSIDRLTGLQCHEGEEISAERDASD